jgi:ribonucleoside-diphosphate reductase beta chain
MQLWERAKVQGTWNPSEIDFSEDRRNWLRLTEEKKARLMELFRLFQSGEEAVTLDLLPLLQVIAEEGRFEEEIYLTSFLLDEAKHTDLFHRFLTEVCCDVTWPVREFTAHERLFDELHQSLGQLNRDRSAASQMRAAVTYHIVIEGIVAETGYFLLRRALSHGCPLPGMLRAIDLLQRDEGRHIAFGMYFACRLIAEHGDLAYRAFLDRMWDLKPHIDAAGCELIGSAQTGDAFGVSEAEVIRFGRHHFANCVRRILETRAGSRTRDNVSMV